MDKESVFYAETYFSGRVQGVGFRWHVLDMAKEFEVSGRVMNMDDGRVLLELEGYEDEVNGFIDQISEQLKVFIKDVQVKSKYRPREFWGFRIEHQDVLLP